MNRPTPKVGLLPLYLQLYDDHLPERRAGCEEILHQVRDGLSQQGLDVVTADVCHLAAEVTAAVSLFEKREVDCIATLHLAYSPSLESLPALTRTTLPIIIVDTTIDARFGTDTHPDRIMVNHGVHGVMDLASVLRRHERPFQIVAGHVTESHVLKRTADLARAAVAADRFRQTRALRIGHAFAGMGDFSVDEPVMRERLGIQVDQVSPEVLAKEMKSVSDADIETELAADAKRYDIRVDNTVYRRSVHTGLALRRILASGRYTAFSANFQAFQSPQGPVMPFLECSKAMARGIGYAGEGDVLTAGLVGALASVFGETTFTEIFCSDWSGNSLFLSHMGEINPELAPDRPLVVVKDYAFVGAGPSAAVVCGIRPGPAVYVNLAPGPANTFELIVAPVDMLPDTERDDLRQVVRGWMRPARPVSDFLEEYSRHGGTHHSALVLGEKAEAIRAFAAFAGLECVML